MIEETVELQDYLKVVSKYKRLIIAGTLLCLAAALIVTAYLPPVYETSLQILVRQKQLIVDGNGQSTGEAYQAILVSERLAKTFSQMLENRSTAEKVIKKLNIGVSPTELTQRVTAEPIRDTQLIKITVQGKNPAQAQLIANTLGGIFKDIVDNIESDDQLLSDSGSLVKISVVEPAIKPVEPIQPKPLLNAVLALLIGLMSSVVLAFLLNHLDTTIKESDEVEQMSGLISLGRIPTIQKGSTELIIKNEPRSLPAEAFRLLRTNIQYINFESTIKTIVITSAGVGEGKTLFCANFAAALARARHRVLVVGCDLRRPRLHHVFDIGNDIGLANYLVGVSKINEVIQKTEIDDLDVIVGGPIPPNPVDLLESRRMGRFLEEVSKEYDYVILDSPPISTITDALVLVTRTDGVILLARHGMTNKQSFIHAKAMLDKVDARILGFVLNATDTGHPNSSYEYYQKAYRENGNGKVGRHPRGRRVKVFAAVLLFAGILVVAAYMRGFDAAGLIVNMFWYRTGLSQLAHL